MIKSIALAVVLMMSSAAIAAEHGESAPTAFRVIVNPANNVASLSHKQLLDLFLKKRTHWENDEAVRAVDLSVDSPVRRLFSEQGMGRPVAAIKSYWQESIFSGRDVPPVEVDTEDDVVKYVLKNSGAIGYVSTKVDIGTANVVTVK